MRSYLTRIGALTAAGSLLAALPMCARDTSPVDTNSTQSPDADESSARAALEGRPLGQVISRDALGKARVISGGHEASPAVLDVRAETAARVHLLRHVEALGLDEDAVRRASLVTTHPIAGGASVVQFEQRVDGIEVFRSRASVVVDATKNLVSIGSNLRLAGAAGNAKKLNFAVTAEKALTNLYGEHFGRSLNDGAVRDLGPVSGGELRGLKVSTAKDAPRMFDATSKRVLFADAYGLTPAYYLEFIGRAPGSRENHAWGYVVSAKDSRVLYKTSLTQSEAFTYRVWADNAGDKIPYDGPLEDYTPHPTGTPEPGKRLNPRPTQLVTIDGFNATHDPWLPATATVTHGNNVHAYSDRNHTHGKDDAGALIDGGDPDLGDGFEPGKDLEGTTTADKTFDRAFSTTAEPNANENQIKASITQLFYVNNWLHDYWYDSGFNEKSGVAQTDNLGRGGTAGDPLLAEAQDGADFGERNNANMSTPADGKSPRMQMFVWSGIPNRTITRVGGAALTFTDGFGAPGYGPQTFEVINDAVLVQDATDPKDDACEDLTNGAAIAGKIAIIMRSGTAGCTFSGRAQRAVAAGAAGVIIINNGPDVVNPSGGNPLVTKAVLTMSDVDGAKLRAAMAAGAVRLRMWRGPEVLIDGTLDNTIVAHEWGHYLHHRLVICGSKACGGMSEGWADFTALHMAIKEGDMAALDAGVFPLAQYATAGDRLSTYNGIRRAPYSANLEKNPFTFTHMQGSSGPPEADMSEVHNVGEIWASMLFEGYINLLKLPGSTFQEKKRRMADAVVAGMKAAPVEPTFSEQRDAILASLWASTAPHAKEDFTAIAKGFAKRGLGVGAVSPKPAADPNTDTLEGIVESDVVDKGEASYVDSVIDVPAETACDADGVLDSGETGKVTVRVRNSGWAALTGTKVKVSTTDPTVTFGSGGEATVSALDPYGVGTVVIPVTAGRAPIARSVIPLDITITNDAAHTTKVTATHLIPFNVDDVAGNSTVDNVEAATSPWSASATPLKAWSRLAEGTNHVWHGNDSGTSGDETLVSPDVFVGQGDFTISFRHRYLFEYTPEGQDPPVFWDGGVLELSDDGGKNWKDISEYADPGYPHTVLKSKENPLSERKAWAAVSEGYPNYKPVTLNLAKKLAGKTVKVRFRIGTDGGSGAAGWDIDDIAFAGITNLPFPVQVDDRAQCVTGPGADAGDQGVPFRVTNSEDQCGVSPVIGNSTTKRGLAGLGIFGGLLMLLGLRRRR